MRTFKSQRFFVQEVPEIAATSSLRWKLSIAKIAFSAHSVRETSTCNKLYLNVFPSSPFIMEQPTLRWGARRLKSRFTRMLQDDCLHLQSLPISLQKDFAGQLSPWPRSQATTVESPSERSFGQDFYQTYARTRVERAFFLFPAMFCSEHRTIAGDMPF